MLPSIPNLLAITALLTPIAIADCTRAGLPTTATTYFTAQTNGQPSTLALNTLNFAYKENNKITDINKGVLSQHLNLELNRTTADTVTCASYTLSIYPSKNGSKPYVLATQIRHPVNDTSVISMIDTVAATTGALFFDAAQKLMYLPAENWTALEIGKRPSREMLRRVGDAYLDMWTDGKAADLIPWGTNCEQIEGSRLTRPCGGALTHGGSAKVNGNRRYVIDETVRSVEVLCSFDSLDLDMPDSHEIRVEDGKVKYVHTVTVYGSR
ncbi:hypothetical protein HYALB_00005871 [Hymenoscyphus albidus]|uniref:DUF8021 domain-containing protein n=1 Tax=Hymenoscyphus albidus TaxID=595503 RepID=A0A9N9M146_9HELO|nr:hypothetical protein HYALB_00005871 [Hymenoscyphus albidus]